MTHMPLYSLSLDNSDSNKNWLLQLYTENTETGNLLAEKFKQVAMETFRRISYSKWFLQGESKEWKMFEFWDDDQRIILTLSMMIAKAADLDLEIDSDEIRLRSVLEANWARDKHT